MEKVRDPFLFVLLDRAGSLAPEAIRQGSGIAARNWKAAGEEFVKGFVIADRAEFRLV